MTGESEEGSFDQRLVRGAIIRFTFDEFSDPDRPDPGPKFAIVLNNPAVTEPIYLVLTTSNVHVYEDKPQFKHVLVYFFPGEYGFKLRTVVPFRDNPIERRRDVLRSQHKGGELTFHGMLIPLHLDRVNAAIRDTPYIRRNLKPFISPDQLQA